MKKVIMLLFVWAVGCWAVGANTSTLTVSFANSTSHTLSFTIQGTVTATSAGGFSGWGNAHSGALSPVEYAYSVTPGTIVYEAYSYCNAGDTLTWSGTYTVFAVDGVNIASGQQQSVPFSGSVTCNGSPEQDSYIYVSVPIPTENVTVSGYCPWNGGIPNVVLTGATTGNYTYGAMSVGAYFSQTYTVNDGTTGTLTWGVSGNPPNTSGNPLPGAVNSDGGINTNQLVLQPLQSDPTGVGANPTGAGYTNAGSVGPGQVGQAQGVGTNTFVTLPSPTVWAGAPTSGGAATNITQAIWSSGQTINIDLSGVINAVDTVGGTAHADAGTLKSAIDAVRIQAHSDAGAIATILMGLTNGSAGAGNNTNLAQDSTLQAVGASINTNLYGIYTNIFGVLADVQNLSSNGSGLAMSNLNLGIQQSVGSLGSGVTNLGLIFSNMVAAVTNLNAFTNLDVAAESTQRGISNILSSLSTNLTYLSTNIASISLTNYALETTLDRVTNALGQAVVSAVAGSNGIMGSVSGVTNGAIGVGNALGASVLASYGALPVVPVLPAPADGFISLPFRNGALTLSIGASSVPTLGASRSVVQSLLGAIVWVCTFVAMLNHASKCMLRVEQQQQLQGSKQVVTFLGFGGNAALPTALVYGGVVAALLASFPVALVAYFTTVRGSGIDSLGASIAQLTSDPLFGQLYNMVTTFVPVAVIVTAFFSWVIFRFFVCDIICITFAAIILFLFA